MRWSRACSLAALVVVGMLRSSSGDATAGGLKSDEAPVYASAFGAGADKAWSMRAVGHTPTGGRAFLGPFASQSVTLSLHDLPAHRTVEVTVEMFVIGGWTGRAGLGSWKVEVVNGPTLIDTDFATGTNDAGARQSYPDMVMQGNFAAGAGAAENGTLGYKAVLNAAAANPQEVPADSVYRMTLACGHSSGDLTLRFTGSGLRTEALERWGLAAVRVSLGGAANELTASEAGVAWDQLQSLDGEKAGAAEARLLRGGDGVVPLLQDRLTMPRDKDAVRRMIGDLDSDDAAARQRAAEQLVAQGPAVERMLRQTVEAGAAAEVARRIEEVLQRIRAAPGPTGEQLLQQGRTVALLERLGNAAARGALEEIRTRSYWPRARREALAALDRRARTEALAALEQGRRMARKGDQAAMAGAIADAALALRGSALQRLSDDWQLQSALNEITWTGAAAAQEGVLRAALANDPHDGTARLALEKLYLTDLDDAPAAAGLLDTAQDAAWRGYMTAAAAPESLGEATLLELAAWYRGLAADAGPLGKRNALRRARDLYDRACMTWAAGEPRLADVAKTLRELDRDLAALDEADQEWLDLAALAPVLNKPNWSRTESGELLLQAAAFATMTIPAEPQGSYELKLSFKRTQGEHGVFVSLPVGATRADLNLAAWSNTLSGLEQIDGQGANGNVTTVVLPWVNGRTYHLLARVLVKDKRAAITVTVDGRPFIQWQGEAAALSGAAPWWTADPAAVTLGAHLSDVTFSEVRLRTLGGKAKVTTQPAGGP